MTATIIDGRAIAAQIKAEVAERVQALVDRGIQPGPRRRAGGRRRGLADLRRRQAQGVLPRSGSVRSRSTCPGYVTEGELLATIRRLNRDPEIHGIIVQLPLPEHINELEVQTHDRPARRTSTACTRSNVGMMVRGEPTFPPATPYGIVELLLRSGVQLEGAEVVVVGYGDLVGAPLSIMLAQDSIRGNATVTMLPREDRDLAAHTRRADILVAAAGVPKLVTADMVKPGRYRDRRRRAPHRATGWSATWRSSEALEVAGAITPVPGGVGPMTAAMLLLEHGLPRPRSSPSSGERTGGRLEALVRSRRFGVTCEVVPPARADAERSSARHASSSATRTP